MRHRPGDSEKVEELQYELDGAVAKERRAEKTAECLQRQLGIVRATVGIYRRVYQTLPNVSEWASPTALSAFCLSSYRKLGS